MTQQELDDSIKGVLLANGFFEVLNGNTRGAQIHAIKTILYALQSADEMNDVEPTIYEILIEDFAQ